MTQGLLLIQKDLRCKLRSRKILEVAFVPMMDEDHDSGTTQGNA